jgi:hypothetical protein
MSDFRPHAPDARLIGIECIIGEEPFLGLRAQILAEARHPP